MSSLADAVKAKNDTAVAKAVIDAFKAQSPSPTPTASPAPPAKSPKAPTPPANAPAAPPGSSSTNNEANVKDASNHVPPRGLTVNAKVGIAVGSVAIVLMLAAFTLWYRRFKRRSASLSASPASPSSSTTTTTTNHNKRNKRQHQSSTAHTNGSSSSSSTTPMDFEAIDTSRVVRPPHWLATADRTNGPWTDPLLVAARIPLEKLETFALLARGGFGEVYRGAYKSQVVAIKQLLPATRKDLSHITNFFVEIQLLASLEHERIVTFVGVAWDALTDVCAVSEFMDGGDLRTLLMRFEVQEQRPHGLDATKLRIALHVAHALTYLHSLEPVVLHRDLKSKNILLDMELNAKLTDFGVSRTHLMDATMTAGVGTSLWMAPEVMLGERYDHKSDIFSFGIVLSELDAHLLPYAHAKHADSGQKLTDTAILQLVSMGQLRVAFSASVSLQLKTLGDACVEVDPAARPSAAEVLYKLQLALKAAVAAEVGELLC